MNIGIYLALLLVILGILSIVVAPILSDMITNYYLKPPFFNTYADFIPSKSIDDTFILNKDGSFSCIIIIDGYPYHQSDDVEASKTQNYQIKKRALNFNNLEKNVHVKFGFKRLKEGDSYSNGNYIEVTSEDKEILTETVNRLKSSLSVYQPRILENRELLEFIWLNCNLFKKVLKRDYSQVDINDMCSVSTLSFCDKGEYGLFNNIETKNKFFKCLTFNYGNYIDDQYYHDLMTGNFSFDFIINTKFFSKLNAQRQMSSDKKNITSSQTDGDGVVAGMTNVSQRTVDETYEVQEILDNEEANLTVFDSFIIVFADSVEQLDKDINSIKNIIAKYEITVSEEKGLLSFFFMQRLIGFRLSHTFKFFAPHSEILIYAKKMLTCTLAGLFDYINTPKGLTKCDWGDKPLATFNTHHNNLYSFYPHVSEKDGALGHGVVIASSGGGKTTFIEYIIKGILENYKNVDVYSFDRLNGMSVFNNWIGGREVDFTEEMSINPLQIDLEEEENKQFLLNFLQLIAKPQNEYDKEDLENIVKKINIISMEERILSKILDDMHYSAMRDSLRQWAYGQYASYINAKEDNFNLDNQYINFQMKEILEDEILAAPIMYYIMHKIRQKAKTTGRKHFIFIDETSGMLKSEYFLHQMGIMLKEHRKLGGCVWLAFQNAGDFLNDEKIQELVLNQCQTQVIFESVGIKEEVLNKLNIDKSIYSELIKQKNKNEYSVILKKPNESVILDINMKEKLGDNLKFFSSNNDLVIKMNELKNKHGNEWIKYF